MDSTMLPIDITLLCVQHECNQHASFEMVYVYCVSCNPCLFVCYLNCTQIEYIVACTILCESAFSIEFVNVIYDAFLEIVH